MRARGCAALEPLEPYLDKDPAYKKDILADIPENVLNLYRDKPAAQGGKLYGLPPDSNCQLQFYRVDIFDKASLKPAVTWDEAIELVASRFEAAKAAASAAHVLLVYPNQKSIGTFVWPTALSVPKTAKNREAAQRLAERLADRGIEQLLVARVPGYLPLRSDIPVPPGVRSAANLVVISVDPARIVSEIGQRKASLAAWAASIPKPLPAGARAQTK